MTFLPVLMMFALAQSPAKIAAPPASCSEIRTRISHNDLEEADKLLKSSSAAGIGCESEYLLLARAYISARQFEKANAASLQAFQLKQSVDAYLLIATASMEMHKLNESIQWLQHASVPYPDDARIYKILGLNYALAGMMVEAAGAFQTAAKLDGKNWEYAYMEGRALTELNKLNHAQAALRRAAELNGLETKIETALGQTYERAHADEKAEQSYRKAVEKCSGDNRECVWPLLDLGILLSRERGFAEAEPWLVRAVHADPQWAKPHFYLAKAYAARNDTAGACEEFEAAARLDHDKSEYHYELAQTYRALGRPTDATRELSLFRQTAALEKRTLSAIGLR